MAISDRQRRFLKEPLPRMTIVEGCISSGKTFISNHKSVEHIVNNYTHKGLIFFVGRTLTTLERNILQPLAMQYKGYFTYSLSQKKADLCGIRIELEGCNDLQAEAKIRGSTAEYIYGDEITLWNKPFLMRCMGSLRVPGACFLGTTNPDSPLNFVKTDYLDRQEELGLRNIAFFMDDNPILTDEYKAQVSLEYVGVYHDRFIKGWWVLAQGLIYPNYKIAVVKTVVRTYTKYQISIDYGTENPFAMGLYGLNNGTWYKFREYRHSGKETNVQKTDQEYYEELVKFAGDLKIEQVIIDPSAASFIALIRQSSRFNVKKAANDVNDGIRMTSTAMQTGKLMINDCCVHTIKEFQLYSWDEKKSSKNGMDIPIKENDHSLDETRYFVYTNKLALPKRKSLIG